MIRPFNLRDLALVHRLGEQGVSLHTKSALTGNLHPLRGALVNFFVRGDYPTYVWKAEQGSAAGFIQLYVRENNYPAHILYLSSVDVQSADENGDGPHANSPINEEAWLTLLDQAVVEVGQRGIHNLVAEVNETGPELPVLRRAGFAVHMRQDIWVLPQLESLDGEFEAQLLTPYQPGDDWDVQLLYANTVPRLVQMVDPMPPPSEEEGWVLCEGGELMAFVHLHEGTIGTWLRLFIHPNAEVRAREIVASALRLKSQLTAPIYCCLPRYQSWLQAGLERTGFRFWGSQAVMVRYTVHHSRKPLMEKTAVLETKGIPASSPMVQRYQQYPDNGKSCNCT